MNKCRVHLLCLALLTIVAQGCAFSTDKVAIKYPSRGAREKINGAEKVKVSVTMTDQREVRDKLGKKINGFGGEVGRIASTTDVVEVFRAGIESELTQRGFAGGTAVSVSGNLNKFYNHFKQGFWAGESIAEASFEIQVKNPEGGVVFSKSVVAEGIEPSIQVANGNNAQRALELAMWNAVEQLFRDPDFIPALFKAAGESPP